METLTPWFLAYGGGDREMSPLGSGGNMAVCSSRVYARYEMTCIIIHTLIFLI